MSILGIAKDFYTKINNVDNKNLHMFNNNASTPLEDISSAFLNAPFENRINFLKQYGNSIWVYICISAIAKAVSSIPINIFIKNTKENDFKKSLNHPIAQLFKKVNNWTTFSQLLFSTTGYLKLKGNAYWILISKNNEPVSLTNSPIEIWVVNPEKMFVIPDKNNFIKGYAYVVDGNMIPLATTEVIHIKDFNPSNDFYGQSTIKPLINTLLSEKNAIEYNAAFYENSSIPQGVLTTDQSLTDPIYKRLRGMWNSRYGGVSKSHKTAILEKGLKFTNITVSQRDADFINSRKMNREEILAAFGVPPIIAGLETQNFATAKEQRLVYWEETILPTIKIIIDHLQEFLVPLYIDSDKITLKPDLTKSPALKLYQEKNDERARNLFKDGLITKNEARTNFLDMDGIGLNGDTFFQNNLKIDEITKEKNKNWNYLFEGEKDWEMMLD